jgi:hypothetical protein
MKDKWKHVVMAGVVMVIFGAAGCAVTPQPYEYRNDLDEKPGPGLFSGEAGGFVIMGEKSRQKIPHEKTPPDSKKPVDSKE